MTLKTTLLSIPALFLFLLTGCASSPWRAEDIPVPRSTPFDYNEFARNSFLQGFREGYRAEIKGTSDISDAIAGSNIDARRQGYYAGVAQARAAKAGTSQK